MSASEDGQDAESTISQLFDRCMRQLQEVRDATVPSTDHELQTTVRGAISGLESLTREVSAAGLFSSNEAVDELPTGSLRFLLLPAMLGELTCRLAHEDRMQVIGIAEVYYRDFLQRCRDYSITDVEIPAPRSGAEDTEAPQAQPRPPTMRALATMSKQREERLRRYREQKELDKQLAELREAMKRPSPDDETVRNYHLTLLRQAVGKAVAELQSLEQEKPILEHMQRLKVKGGSAAEETANPAPTVAPLRPVVITRTKLEAQVFGSGYSSLPTMSVEEFYEQRVRDGVFPGGCRQTSHGRPAAQPTSAEDRDELQERLEESDDPATLARARQWDDYKDNHKRGEGNRYNRS